MKIFLITVDTNLINTKQEIAAMNKLEDWNNKGLIQLLKTSTMDVEFEKHKNDERRKRFLAKSSRYKEDHGINLVDHCNTFMPHCCIRNEIFDTITEILFPNLTREDKNFEQKIRDAMHLNTYYMNDRDFFVTNDKHFLSKKDDLKSKFGIKIIKPEKCVELIESFLKNDNSGSMPIRDPDICNPSIIVGNELSSQLCIKDNHYVYLAVKNLENKYFYVYANLWNKDGYHVAECSPEGIKCHYDKGRVSCSLNTENIKDIYMPFEKQLYSELFVSYDNELLLGAELLKSRDLLLYCKLYSTNGEIVANIHKDKCEVHPGCFFSYYMEDLGNGRVNMQIKNI